MRIVISNNVKGGDYKYIDYYSGYNLKLPHKIDLRKTIFSYKDLKNLRENHFIQEDIIKNKQCDLLLNFPFKLSTKYQYFKKILCNNIY